MTKCVNVKKEWSLCKEARRKNERSLLVKKLSLLLFWGASIGRVPHALTLPSPTFRPEKKCGRGDVTRKSTHARQRGNAAKCNLRQRRGLSIRKRGRCAQHKAKHYSLLVSCILLALHVPVEANDVYFCNVPQRLQLQHLAALANFQFKFATHTPMGQRRLRHWYRQ